MSASRSSFNHNLIPAALTLLTEQGLIDLDTTLCDPDNPYNQITQRARELELCGLSSNFVAVTGIGFGDEGKGRAILEVLNSIKSATGQTDRIALVFKVNGGANSGHTANGVKLNLLPCGVVDADCRHIGLGQGVVADPIKLEWETRLLEQKYHLPVTARLVIDPGTMVTHLLHRLEDLAQEYYRVEVVKGTPRGSTGRGISPAFMDEATQQALYYRDFLGDKSKFASQLQQRAICCVNQIRYVYQVPEEVFAGFFCRLQTTETRAHHDYSGVYQAADFDFSQYKGSGYSINTERLIDNYWQQGRQLISNIKPLSELVRCELRSGNYVVGEFGQAYLLGKRTGFQPSVTASNPYTPEIFCSAAIPVDYPVHNITCAKAYSTKVGNHIFLTEIGEDHPLGRKLRRQEFGVTTGRQRMVGWPDAVEMAHTLVQGGFSEIVINKLDALSYSDDWYGNLKICTAYKNSAGEILRRLPFERDGLEPVYLEIPGWAEEISQVRSFTELPINAQRFIAKFYSAIIENAQTQCPLFKTLPRIRFIGVGPNPGELIQDIPDPLRLLRLAEN